MYNVLINNFWRQGAIFVLPVMIWVSCSHSTGKKMPDKLTNNKEHASQRKAPSSYADTVTIDFSAAVFYSPDSLQLEKIRSATDPGPFGADMHEYYFLMRNARLVINKNYPHLRIVNVEKARYLLFVRSDNSRDCIDLNTQRDPYGLFAFNRKDPPLLMDMPNIDSDLGFYFGNK